MITRPVTISLETYATLLDKENLGDPHTTLVGGSRWYPPEVRQQRDVRVLRELTDQGLTSGNRASDDFRDTLVTMQRPAVEYYTIASIDGTTTTIRAAAHGRDALLITSHGEQIEIAPIPAEQMGARLAAALPTVPAARVHSMSCDPADLDAAEKGEAFGSDASSRDAKRMKRFLDQDRSAAGQLYAAIRDGHGRRYVNRTPVPFWLDTTEAGRALLSPTEGGWITLIGADVMTIANKLSELENSLRGR
ncbi:ESX secretion-associated protein EspG [Haloechinothrix sp. LS1_15]|uniref:ESX secretion-associated protein EspG n=1 Tax=Haloechinothrix sp. LS1_15 TaxID=2652248 RepID=UPI0029461E0D|nr:ESX secretion-associated protein EspG [Haloechinothrix sp. LS1_15]MDV6012560.1 ESX secretion-associated protein EspG [Haloechinothrix sp. LS1_15]